MFLLWVFFFVVLKFFPSIMNVDEDENTGREQQQYLMTCPTRKHIYIRIAMPETSRIRAENGFWAPKKHIFCDNAYIKK